MEKLGMKIKTEVNEVKLLMDEVYKAMVRVGAIPKIKAFEGRCCYCQKVCSAHTIRECEMFEKLLQRMVDQKEIEFSGKIMEESINVITLTIFFEDDSISMTDITMDPPKPTIKVPSLFSYTDNKMVPWNYNYNYVNELATANMLGIKGMTRSGKCYALVSAETTPLNLIKEPLKQKNQK